MKQKPKEIRCKFTPQEHKKLKKLATHKDVYLRVMCREFILKGLLGLCKDTIKYNRSDNL